MTLAARRNKPLVGSDRPRIAPPTPARSQLAEFVACADGLGIDLMPWQRTAARYITALGQADKWLYREVGIVVARQNGKTTLLVPLIVSRLRAGQRIMHTAQDRALPREVFEQVADIMSQDLTLFPMRNGRATRPRFANGQEEIKLNNGGSYSIVAPTRGGARGPSRDLVIVDELREMDTWDFISAAKPTMTVSKNAQMLYLSNAGEDDSIVLNALRDRAGSDPKLAYLEWSAAPNRKVDDRKGWSEANPAMGNEVGEMGSVLETLETEYRTNLLQDTLHIFETEYLCRWVKTTRKVLIDVALWTARKAPTGKPIRPSLAVSMDPAGRRASVAIAWTDGQNVAVKLLYDVTGDPIDTDRLGTELSQIALKHGATVGYDPYTDAEFVKYLTKTESINGGKYANASAQFVNLITAGKLRWDDADAVTDDLAWTARKDTGEASYHAVRLDDDRPITAVLAAIRAVWLASGPKPALPRVM